jgi:hypothetical protein
MLIIADKLDIIVKTLSKQSRGAVTYFQCQGQDCLKAFRILLFWALRNHPSRHDVKARE